MPRNQFQRCIFALITVIITVHAYVFYSLYVVNGRVLMEVTGADSVLHAIIFATVGLMCPAMSFLASFFYYPYYVGFNLFTLLANWLKLMCFNLPFAVFTQLMFIQPFVRVVFKTIFAKQISERVEEYRQKEKEGEPIRSCIFGRCCDVYRK